MSFGELRLVTGSSQSIARRIWPSSLVICQYIQEKGVFGKRILDIGSGTGVAAAVALKKGASQVFLQDLPGEEDIWSSQQELMQLNGLKNGFERLEMRWGDLVDVNIDLIISADTFYEPKGFPIPIAFL